MEDLNPPPTFLASLDVPMDGFATDSAAFFGNGGVGRPSGLLTKLNGDLGSTGPASALLLERHLTLRPQESRTLCFLYGYAPQGFQIGDLVSKYSVDPAGVWARSSAAWKNDGPDSPFPPSLGWKGKPPGITITCAATSPTTVFFANAFFRKATSTNTSSGFRARAAIRCNMLCLSSSATQRWHAESFATP